MPRTCGCVPDHASVPPAKRSRLPGRQPPSVSLEAVAAVEKTRSCRQVVASFEQRIYRALSSILYSGQLNGQTELHSSAPLLLKPALPLSAHSSLRTTDLRTSSSPGSRRPASAQIPPFYQPPNAPDDPPRPPPPGWGLRWLEKERARRAGWLQDDEERRLTRTVCFSAQTSLLRV